MNYFSFYQLVLFIVLWWYPQSCVLGQDCNSVKSIDFYDIEVSYLAETDNQRPCAIDSLLIILEGYFNEDLIQIYINGEIYYENKITSDESTSLSGVIYVENFKLVSSVGIRKNRGKMAFVETNNQCHPIGVRFDYVRKVLQVLLYTQTPFFH
ncbi:hypothetical protein [Alkalitalea saponilacus]|uniref:Uncharacterized protein n=1 Tax=Alkalitalea saponilacus TaxID=889453 RepID=A0A1T5APL0_9BACT|nr:hypothetical protein [Alkalitalea saponilacus]ASB48635.1 hypothetical protein CDL62_05510 [Alkalitalea saponilacus]SKB36815.1 hypothetical protein SAMN03080601_00338 [Alkalitalea saponilacus]